MKHYRRILPALLIAAMTSVAAAQTSEITGTLSTGGATTTGSSLTGTVTSTPGGGQLSGTVVAPGGSGTGTGTGGSGGPSGPGPSGIDICSNIADLQSTLPSGYVLQNGLCVLASGTGTGTGTGTPGIPDTGTPGIPDTGAGGDILATFLTLLTLGVAAVGGAFALRRFA